jgi:hypothetical protein
MAAPGEADSNVSALALLNATMRPGIELILELIDFDRRVVGAPPPRDCRAHTRVIGSHSTPGMIFVRSATSARADHRMLAVLK